MKQRIIGLLLVLTLAVTPARAWAEDDGLSGLVAVVFVALVGEGIVVLGNAVTGVGSAVQVGRRRPSFGWSIASTVAGGVATLWGGAFTYVFLSSGETDPGPLLFCLVPLALGATNLALGVSGLVRRRADAELEPEVAPRDEWVLAPILLETRDGQEAPGLAAAVRF